MKQTSTPQACAAWNTAYVTVLFKILILHIITEGKAAIKAEGEIVSEHTFPEGPVLGQIPDIKNIHLRETSEDPWFHRLFQSPDKTAIPVPQEETGVDIPIP